MSLVKRIKGKRLIEEARDALETQAADERARHPVWKRWKGEEDTDMILVSDKKLAHEEVVVRARRSMFTSQQAVLGARLAPVYMQRSRLEEMARAGVERAIHALEEDRRQRIARRAGVLVGKPQIPALALPPDSRKKYRFAVGRAGSRRVTVRAGSESEAQIKAADILAKRAEKAGKEPPAIWDLRLLEVS